MVPDDRTTSVSARPIATGRYAAGQPPLAERADGEVLRKLPGGRAGGQPDAHAAVALGAQRPLAAAVARVLVERGDAPVVGVRDCTVNSSRRPRRRACGRCRRTAPATGCSCGPPEPSRPVPATSSRGSAPAPGTSGATTSATTIAAPPSNAAGANQCGPGGALRDQPAAPPVEQREVLREQERAGGDAERRRSAAAAIRRCRASTSTRRTPARARCAANAVVRTNASQSASAAMHHTASTARRIAPSVAGAGAGAVRSRCHPPVSCVSSACQVSAPGSPKVVVDGLERDAPRRPTSPSAASATPTHTDQPRQRTERAERVREERGADHREHEAAGVDDASERQRRDHAERGERERRQERARRTITASRRSPGAACARDERLVPRGRERCGGRVDDDHRCVRGERGGLGEHHDHADAAERRQGRAGCRA